MSANIPFAVMSKFDSKEFLGEIKQSANQEESFFSKAKSKSLAVVGAVALGATNGFSAVTVGTDGTLSGSLDMAGYNSALTIVIAATIAIVIGGIILRTIKKV